MAAYVVCFVSVWCVAQGDTTGKPTCITPATCTRDLRSPLPEFANDTAIKNKTRCYALGCTVTPPAAMPANYHDVAYDAGDAGAIGCPNSVADCSQDGSVLQYQAFYPDKNLVTNFATCKLPVVIFFHGGSFADCNGSFDAAEIQNICTQFARRGFIAISVGYRTGVKVLPNDYYTVQQMLGIYRACQDARGAIRSIIKHEITTATAQKETDFHIDTSKIFVAGNSAGSVIAMNVAYYTLNTMVTSAFPPGINASNVLGGINQNFYYGGDGTASTGSINYTIKGVLDLWGGILLPNGYSPNGTGTNPSENFFFQTGNVPPPPTIAFCGKKDPVFDYTSKPLQFSSFSPSSVLSENFCLNDQSGNTSYTVSPGSYGYILGSQRIYEMLRRKQVFTEFYLDCQMEHGLTKPPYTPGSPFVSNFGTTANDITSVNLYIVQRACTFFQAVMNNPSLAAANIHTTKFVECQNNRNTCAAADNNNGCPADTSASQQVCP